MRTKQMPLDKLKHPQSNVRVHPERQMKAYKKSVEQFGQTRPVVIDEDNEILIGNGLVEAMRALGWEKAAVIVKEGLAPTEKKKLMLADNKIYDLGVDDYDIQHQWLSDIVNAAPEFDFEIPGFEPGTLEALFATGDKVTAMIAGEGNSNAGTSNGGGDAKTGSAGTGGEEGEYGEDASGQFSTAPPENKQEMKCPHCGGLIWF